MHDMIRKIVRIKNQESRIKGEKIGTSLRSSPKTDEAIPMGDNAFAKAISQAKDVAIIAELKFASPSAGTLGSPGELLERAKMYEQAGADAISIITEEHFFQGKAEFIPQVKKHVQVPILQKDFIIDEKQIYQAKELGADALLLIARIVEGETLTRFVELCGELDIEPVVEVHTKDDLEKALVTKTKIIAVNARNLDTFEVNVLSACELLRKIPESFITLGFSGVHSAKEVRMYKDAGVKGVLIGTSLMKADSPGEFFKITERVGAKLYHLEGDSCTHSSLSFP